MSCEGLDWDCATLEVAPNSRPALTSTHAAPQSPRPMGPGTSPHPLPFLEEGSIHPAPTLGKRNLADHDDMQRKNKPYHAPHLTATSMTVVVDQTVQGFKRLELE